MDRGRVEGELVDKEKGQQMLWKFLHKVMHVLLLEDIAEMTVKPQRSPALCHGLARRKYIPPKSSHRENNTIMCVYRLTLSPLFRASSSTHMAPNKKCACRLQMVCQ